jgi:hypothetical protein
MLDVNAQRQDALEDGAGRGGNVNSPEWAMCSRIWSRQQEALSCAIIAEPPEDMEDVLAVLAELAAHHDLISGQDEVTARELRDLHEMSAVAVVNCAAAMSRLLTPEQEPTEAEHASRVWLFKRIEQWLPAKEGR